MSECRRAGKGIQVEEIYSATCHLSYCEAGREGHKGWACGITTSRKSEPVAKTSDRNRVITGMLQWLVSKDQL